MPRVTDVYAALPSMTGKFELEYEGELKGADQVARDLVRAAVGNVFDGYFGDADAKQIIEWFDLGGSLEPVGHDRRRHAGQGRGGGAGTGRAARSAPASTATRRRRLIAAAIDFLLEGLYSQKKISRSDVRGYHGAEPARRPQPQQPRTRDPDAG